MQLKPKIVAKMAKVDRCDERESNAVVVGRDRSTNEGLRRWWSMELMRQTRAEIVQLKPEVVAEMAEMAEADAMNEGQRRWWSATQWWWVMVSTLTDRACR